MSDWFLMGPLYALLPFSTMRLRRMERDAGKRRQTAGDADTLKRDASAGLGTRDAKGAGTSRRDAGQERLGARRFGARDAGRGMRDAGAGRFGAGRGREGRGMRDAKGAGRETRRARDCRLHRELRSREGAERPRTSACWRCGRAAPGYSPAAISMARKFNSTN